MTRAIEEEPPLPGDDLSGWKGLRAAELDLGEPVHEHHRHHREDGHDGEHDHEHRSEPHEEPHGHGSHATSGTKANDEPSAEGPHVAD